MSYHVCIDSSTNKKERESMEELKLYTVEEVMEILSISRRTLYNYIKSGSLKAVKIGRQWRIRLVDLKAFIENADTNT